MCTIICVCCFYHLVIDDTAAADEISVPDASEGAGAALLSLVESALELDAWSVSLLALIEASFCADEDEDDDDEEEADSFELDLAPPVAWLPPPLWLPPEPKNEFIMRSATPASAVLGASLRDGCVCGLFAACCDELT